MCPNCSGSGVTREPPASAEGPRPFAGMPTTREGEDALLGEFDAMLARAPAEEQSRAPRDLVDLARRLAELTPQQSMALHRLTSYGTQHAALVHEALGHAEHRVYVVGEGWVMSARVCELADAMRAGDAYPFAVAPRRDPEEPSLPDATGLLRRALHVERNALMDLADQDKPHDSRRIGQLDDALHHLDLVQIALEGRAPRRDEPRDETKRCEDCGAELRRWDIRKCADCGARAGINGAVEQVRPLSAPAGPSSSGDAGSAASEAERDLADMTAERDSLHKNFHTNLAKLDAATSEVTALRTALAALADETDATGVDPLTIADQLRAVAVGPAKPESPDRVRWSPGCSCPNTGGSDGRLQRIASCGVHGAAKL